MHSPADTLTEQIFYCLSFFLPFLPHRPLSPPSPLESVVNALTGLLLNGRTCRRGHVHSGSAGFDCHIKVRVPPAERRNSACALCETGSDRTRTGIGTSAGDTVMLFTVHIERAQV